MIKITLKALSILAMLFALSSCMSPNTDEVSRNGQCMSLTDVFSIPPIKCISKSFALNNEDPTIFTAGVCTKICYEGPPSPINDCPGGTVPATSINPPDDCCRLPSGGLTCSSPWVPRASVGTETKICRNDIFEIRTSLTTPGTGVVQYIVDRIDTVMNGKTQAIYEAMVGVPSDAAFFPIENAIYASVILLITIYGSVIALGITRVNAYTFTMFVLKIALVLSFGLDFTLFNDFVISTIEDGFIEPMSDIMLDVFANSQTSGNAFEQIDGVISMFLSSNYWKVVLALLFSSFSGAAFAAIFVILMIMYLTAVLRALWVYLIALIVRAFLFSFAPIFIMFGLFNQTKGFFDGWVQQIISFSLQPVFLFTYLGMLHLMIRGMLDTSGLQSAAIDQSQYGGLINVADRYTQICWEVIIKSSSFFGDIHWWRFKSLSGDIIEGKNPDIPFNFWVIITIVILTWLMKDLAKWSVAMATSISDGFISASNIPAYGVESMKSIAGMATAGAIGGLSGSIIGKRTAPGVMGTIRRQGGAVGRAQGRGTVWGGTKSQARSANKNQTNKAYDAMRRDLF